jgi:MoaA/NifB/PqqE/SkfB family radical SAM enzyme
MSEQTLVVPAADQPQQISPEEQVTRGGPVASHDVFCVHPWIHLRLQAEGTGRICCRYRTDLSKDGAPLSLHKQSFDEIWNSDEIRDVRRDMVEGREVAGCAECYDEDKNHVISMRARDNAAWQNGWLNDAGETLDDLKSQAIAGGFRLASLPAHIEVDTGSLCNLKCRMCHDGVSSRIATDLVHRSWATDQYAATPYHDGGIVARPAGVRRWSLDKALEAAMVQAPGQVQRLYFVGGEPLLVKEIGELLQRLIDAGVASEMVLAVVSNGTITNSWLDVTRHFKRLDLVTSIDGFAEHYDYIRYPARWEKVVASLRAFRQLPNASLGAAVTLQVYNALTITTLFRYFDSIDLAFHAWPVHVPRYLSVDAMPPPVRKLAAERLSAYADGDCHDRHRDLVRGLAEYVRPKSEAFDPGLLRDFMLFTNDLDLSRGQNIADVDSELVGLIDRAGFPWTPETLHAHRLTLMAAPQTSGV